MISNSLSTNGHSIVPFLESFQLQKKSLFSVCEILRIDQLFYCFTSWKRIHPHPSIHHVQNSIWYYSKKPIKSKEVATTCFIAVFCKNEFNGVGYTSQISAYELDFSLCESHKSDGGIGLPIYLPIQKIPGIRFGAFELAFPAFAIQLLLYLVRTHSDSFGVGC